MPTTKTVQVERTTQETITETQLTRDEVETAVRAFYRILPEASVAFRVGSKHNDNPFGVGSSVSHFLEGATVRQAG